MRFPLALGKQSSAGKAPAESVERLLNGYVETVPDGKEPTPVYGTPGLKRWASGLAGPIRGRLEMTGVLYVVAGGHLYSLDGNGLSTDLGLIPNADKVAIDGDGTNVVIVTAGKIYVWNQANGVVMVTDPDAPNASSVVFIDGFFMFGEANSEQFFISGLGDPINYDALDFASAEWKPDNLITPVVQRRTVFMMGAKTMEAQQNTGAAAFPFQRYSDLFIDVGIAGRDAVVTTNDSMYWLANDFTARRLDGMTATPVSTADINRKFKAWSDPSATICSAHVIAAHLFVVFWNPDGCVAFDQSTQLWHERSSYGSKTWRASHLVDCYGLTLACSSIDGTIYSLDEATFDEDGQPLEFEMVTPFLYRQNLRLSTTELEVVAQTGEGAVGTDPQITAERTRDGKVWSPRKRRSLGRTGENEKRVRFGPQGQARQMAWRFRITDPVRRAILGAYAEADVEA